jgi:hypothetical protein
MYKQWFSNTKLHVPSYRMCVVFKVAEWTHLRFHKLFWQFETVSMTASTEPSNCHKCFFWCAGSAGRNVPGTPRSGHCAKHLRGHVYLGGINRFTYNGPYFATGIIPRALARWRKRWFDHEVVVENLRCQTWQVFFAERFCECLHFEMTSLMYMLMKLFLTDDFCTHDVSLGYQK